MLTSVNIYQQTLFKFEGEEIYFHNLSVSSNAPENFLNYTQNQIKHVKSFYLTMNISLQDYLLYGCVKFYLSLLENNVSLENPTFPGKYILKY